MAKNIEPRMKAKKEKTVQETDTGPVPPDIEIQPNPEPSAPPPKDEKKDPPKPGNAIAVRKGSSDLAPANHFELLAIIDRMIEADAVPRHLKNRLQVLSAWNFAAQLKLPPQPSLRNIAVIEGNPSLFGDLPLSLVQAHKQFKFYREFHIDAEYREISVENKNLDAPIYAGVVEIQRKGMPKPVQYTFTIDEAIKAGLIKWNEQAQAYQGIKRDGSFTPHAAWSKYQGTMLIRRARGKAIKAHFADALCGAGIAEYDFHHAPDLENAREVGERPAREKSGLDSVIDELDDE